MCLLTAKTIINKKDKVGIGYKLFGVADNGDLTGYMVPIRKVFKSKRWMNERDYRSSNAPAFLGDGVEAYPIGFHIYQNINKENIPRFAWIKLFEVKYRKAHTVGKDVYGAKVIVAEEVLITNNEITISSKRFLIRRNK